MNNYGFIKVAAAVPEVRVADCDHNAQRIIGLMKEAARGGVRVTLFPELSLTAYSAGDLLQMKTLLDSAERALRQVVEASAEINTTAIVGLPIGIDDKIFNCAAVVANGVIAGIVPKQHIPNYDEYSECRWFASGASYRDSHLTDFAGQHFVMFGCNLLFKIDGVCFGVEIGEDMLVATPPSVEMAQYEAKIIFNPAATAELVGARCHIAESIRQISKRNIAAYVHSSAGVGESSTDVVYTGCALLAENGNIIGEGERFSLREQLIISDVDAELLQHKRQRRNTFATMTFGDEYYTIPIELCKAATDTLDRTIEPYPFLPCGADRDSRCEEIFAIQTLGLIKRLQHTSCRCAVVGISGGLDSTLALLVTVNAFDRLGLDRKGIIGITMPGFGTTDRTYQNAVTLIKDLGVTFREIPIATACRQHFSDIGLDESNRSVTYENAQARERTQILMDVANMEGGMVIGTGDLSELALGWATYNGDQMSMYGVNGSVPKTLVRHVVDWAAGQPSFERVGVALRDVVATPVSPELLPADDKGEIAQKTEDLVGPYELHDFFLYNLLREGFSPAKILFLAERAFSDRYDHTTVRHWLTTFLRRFFSQQFKRSAMPDGVKVGKVGLSPRGGWSMPSDAVATMWLKEIENL